MIDKDGMLRVGEVIVQVYLDSMAKTDDVIRSLSPKILQKLGDGYEVKIGNGHPPSALQLMVRSHVQNDWFMATRGEIPQMVKQNHEARDKQISKEAEKVDEGSGTGTEKAPRTSAPKPATKFRLGDLSEAQKVELNKSRGQRQIVIKALTGFGTAGGTAEQIAAVIEATGEPYPSKDTVVNSVKYHLKGLRDGAFITEVPYVAPDPAPEA